ncbi:hypothetical protein HY625_02500 [Candidatus Uhrbacteria bacterium]|nr:hypothetical protein [Candidatus Uhrbacteria bacterium]
MALNLLSDQVKGVGASTPKVAETPRPLRVSPSIKKEIKKMPAPAEVLKPRIAQAGISVAIATKEEIVQKKSDTYTQPEAVPAGFGVNILGGSDTYAPPRSLITFFILFAVVFFGGALMIGGWWAVLNNETSRIVNETTTLTTAIGELRTGAAKSIATRTEIEARLQDIEMAKSLLTRHIHWTRFFQFLETVTIPDAYYRSLAVDPGGTIRLAAIGRDFAAVARQLLALQESEDVETVHMAKAASEIVGDAPGVQFDLELKVKPALLYAIP